MKMPAKRVLKTTKVPKAKKTEAKLAKSAIAKKPEAKGEKTVKSDENKVAGLTVNVYDTAGKAAGTMKLPQNLFGAKVNKKLLAQALHIYFTNQKTHNAHTKTRAEVRGGGRKPWRQKGTGNARAGSKRSPLWVGGGITFGPRARKVTLDLPKKMKRAALISALSHKAQEGNITVISNFEKIQPKTKTMAALIAKINVKKPILIITNERSNNVNLASRNIQNTQVETRTNLNALNIWSNKNIIFSREALAGLTQSKGDNLA